MKLEGKIAMVTGGRGGIGRAIVARFLREGATVYAADLSSQGTLADASDDDSRFIAMNVADEASVKSAMDQV